MTELILEGLRVSAADEGIPRVLHARTILFFTTERTVVARTRSGKTYVYMAGAMYDEDLELRKELERFEEYVGYEFIEAVYEADATRPLKKSKNLNLSRQEILRGDIDMGKRLFDGPPLSMEYILKADEENYSIPHSDVTAVQLHYGDRVRLHYRTGKNYGMTTWFLEPDIVRDGELSARAAEENSARSVYEAMLRYLFRERLIVKSEDI